MRLIRKAFLPGVDPTTRGYPFKNMDIGDMVIVDGESDKRRGYLQRYVSNYGAKVGRKFRTRTVGQELHVYRVG